MAPLEINSFPNKLHCSFPLSIYKYIYIYTYILRDQNTLFMLTMNEWTNQWKDKLVKKMNILIEKNEAISYIQLY